MLEKNSIIFQTSQRILLNEAYTKMFVTKIYWIVQKKMDRMSRIIFRL